MWEWEEKCLMHKKWWKEGLLPLLWRDHLACSHTFCLGCIWLHAILEFSYLVSVSWKLFLLTWFLCPWRGWEEWSGSCQVLEKLCGNSPCWCLPGWTVLSIQRLVDLENETLLLWLWPRIFPREAVGPLALAIQLSNLSTLNTHM